MGGPYYDPDRMCSTPGTENRGIDLLHSLGTLGRKGERNQSTFGDPYDPLGTPDWLVSLAEAEAADRKAKQEYEEMLAKAGLTDTEFHAVARQMRIWEEMNYKPKDDDLAELVLGMRPSERRNPMVVDPRGYTMPLSMTAAPMMGAEGLMEKIAPYIVAIGPTVISIALDFVPVIGEIKIVVEAIRGKDTITGAEIPTWARVLGPLGVAAGNGAKVMKGLRAASKVVVGLTKAAAKVAELRVGLRLMAPLLAFVTHARVAGPEAVRILDRLAQIESAGVKAAELEVKGSKAGVALTRLQQAALHDASSILRPAEIAQLQKAPSRMGAALDALPGKIPGGSGLAGSTEALAAEAERRRKQQARKPEKKKTPPKKDPDRRFNTEIRKGSAALQRLLSKKGLEQTWLTAKQKLLVAYKWQMKVTGKAYEYVIKQGNKVVMQIDGIADSTSKPGKLDLIEAKLGLVDDIEKSRHLENGAAKIAQLERYAKFAQANPEEIGKVLVVVGNLKDAKKFGNIVGEIYLNLREALSPELREFIEIVDEEFKTIMKKK